MVLKRKKEALLPLGEQGSAFCEGRGEKLTADLTRLALRGPLEVLLPLAENKERGLDQD